MHRGHGGQIFTMMSRTDDLDTAIQCTSLVTVLGLVLLLDGARR